MPVTLTIRDVPDDVRDALTRESRERGQSLQAYLLGVLQRQAGFSRNREVIAEIERDIALYGDTQVGPSDVVDAIHQARAERDEQILRAMKPGGDDPA
ncbi:MAG: FitA-like ribbon-helix-helix domain-containing protein [Jiangellaceae bacterium]